MKSTYLFAILFSFISIQPQAQIIFSEVAPTNAYQLADENDDYPDWIEIFNSGGSDQNLAGLSLSDNKNPKWTFPDFTLAAGDRVLVYASGKNRGGLGQSKIDHWETALYEGDVWKFFLGTENPPADWTSPSFDDNTWTSAQGSFGYGDGDDVTLVPDTTSAFYYRQTFTVTDPAKLDSAILSMDYDDGFIAYLNGVEIVRSYNMPGGTPDFTTYTTTDHEAKMYGGGNPDVFPISKTELSSLLVTGQNVLAIEIHNVTPPSSDLTARTWLHFAIHTPEVFYGPNPPFFGDITITNFHTNFKIAFGENVRLINTLGETMDSIDIPYLLPGHSIMRTDDTGNWCLTDSPTPETTNGSNCLSGYADTPVISPAAGFYQTDQSITISGNDVRYTTDGSEPNDTSPLYSGPFIVSATSVIRARSFEPGRLAGSTACASYFIGENTQLPVLSITAKPGDLFDLGDGGLAAYDDYNSGRKAPVHLEYFDKDRNLAFSENASLRPVGGYSIAFDQKNMQFSFDEDFGAVDEVNYPIFARDKPHIQRYREFRVRNMDDDWSSTRIRDVVANQLTAPTHCATTGYQHMSVFINGEYWGHYGGREVTNEYYVRDNHGADPDQVDQILTSYFENDKYLVDEGTGDAFFAMSDFIIQHDMSDPANFAAAQKLVDWENWVDYFAAEMYLANGDWFPSVYFNNIRSYRAPDLRWRYIMFDVTYSQGHGVSESTNILYDALANPSVPNRYTDMMNSLLQNEGFERYFINRFADLINEYWTPVKATAIIEDNAAEIASEINRQSARWGSQDSVTWRDLVHDLREFHAVRRVYQRDQIQDYFELNGQVDINLRVEPAEAGVIHINTIIPEKYPWAGIYFNGNPVTITAVANPGYSFDHWENNLGLSILSDSFTINLTEFSSFTAHFTGSAQPVALEVSEINYQSDPTNDAGDWFEIKNAANYPIDLTNFKMQDRNWYNAYPVPVGTILQPGDRIVVVEDDEKFGSMFPNVMNKIGGTGFRLDNGGDQVQVLDRDDAMISQTTFDNQAPWPCTPAGKGRTLERHDNATDPDQPGSWFDGCMRGSPGVAYVPCDDQVIVDEINYHSSDSHDAGDWIEIKNQYNTPIELSGWTIRDDDDEHIFTIPAETFLPAGEYLVVCENEAAFSALHAGVTQRIGDLGFGLNNSGDVIRIYDASGKLQLSICYDDSDPWTSEADGNGYTLELDDPDAILNNPQNWFAGCLGGSPGGPYNSDCIAVAVQPVSTSIEWNIFPNPVDRQLTIQMEVETEGIIKVTDVFGRIIAQQPLTSA
ncbi:MAG TPA: lamin tail domain-containing protein, partial [Saprospiraceae bacterium]|nr:lamin tail domain-containing protein [Saprospiraceae bacterium]